MEITLNNSFNSQEMFLYESLSQFALQGNSENGPSSDVFKRIGKKNYAARYMKLTQQTLSDHIEERLVEYVAPALAGDINAAKYLSSGLSNEYRSVVTMAFWKAKAPAPAFAQLLEHVWVHDHRHLAAFAKSHRQLLSMFQYAEFQIPDSMPDTFRVWRGTCGVSNKLASKGISWTTDRDIACSFALRFVELYGRPLVLTKIVSKDSVMFCDNGSYESEIVLFDVTQATVDGTPSDWSERRDAKIAQRKAEKEEEMIRWKSEPPTSRPKPGPMPPIEYFIEKMRRDEIAYWEIRNILGIHP
ncbi:MAG: hypothetical protein AWT59_2377 [Candidatus Gallionella acididurans]|uniref:Uncharacterized protein n=1 Tax=Candidatus Gallionella acididurans TaxID=1796491 RepID=A0A139BR72_9PROT|nr:MAG: hypothetical protein AWT59_2377 [Candidatus Gallionella acididurans]